MGKALEIRQHKIGMKLLKERHDQLRRIHVVGLHGDQHGRDHKTGGELQSKLRARGQTEVAAMRHLGVVVGESDGRVGDGGEYGDPDEAITQIGPEQCGDDNGNNDQQASHGGRAGFLLMSFWGSFANVLADLEITQAADDERSDNQRGEKRGEAGESRAEGDITENAEGRNVVLQLQEQQPVEQSASECSRQLCAVSLQLLC